MFPPINPQPIPSVTCSVCGTAMPAEAFEGHRAAALKSLAIVQKRVDAVAHYVGQSVTLHFRRRYPPEEGREASWPFSVTRKVLAVGVKSIGPCGSPLSFDAMALLDGEMPEVDTSDEYDPVFTPTAVVGTWWLTPWAPSEPIVGKNGTRLEDRPEVIAWIAANRSDHPPDPPVKLPVAP